MMLVLPEGAKANNDVGWGVCNARVATLTVAWSQWSAVGNERVREGRERKSIINIERNFWQKWVENGGGGCGSCKCKLQQMQRVAKGCSNIRRERECECERANQRGEAAASYCRLFGVGASFTHSRLELLQFECVVSKRNERECSSYSLSPSLCVLVLGCCAWVRAWLYEWEPESVCAHTVVLVFLCVLSVFCFCACIFDICFFAFELFLGPKSSALCEIFSYD